MGTIPVLRLKSKTIYESAYGMKYNIQENTREDENERVPTYYNEHKYCSRVNKKQSFTYKDRTYL